MKDNIFAHWFKELCSLVFIQSIQAFIFAIVMSLIISVMTPDNTNAIERSDFVAATGVIAVIALASISKLEELVKKLFGIQSSITDPGMRGGMKSLATTMMAARLAKGVMDNAGKVATGIGGTVTANRKLNDARTRMAKQMKGLGDESPESSASGGAAGGAAAPKSASQQYLDEANKAKQAGNMDEYQNKMNMAAGAVKAEQNSNNSSGKNDLSKAYEKYQEDIEKLKEQRRGAIFKTISGVTETSGAIAGGLTGAMIGASIGEGKEILNGSLAGMGIGDKLGGAPVKAVETGANIVKGASDYLESRENFVKAVENINSDAKDALRKNTVLKTKYSKARAELDKQMQNFDISDL